MKTAAQSNLKTAWVRITMPENFDAGSTSVDLLSELADYAYQLAETYQEACVVQSGVDDSSHHDDTAWEAWINGETTPTGHQRSDTE